jgi:hypothetical protein
MRTRQIFGVLTQRTDVTGSPGRVSHLGRWSDAVGSVGYKVVEAGADGRGGADVILVVLQDTASRGVTVLSVAGVPCFEQPALGLCGPDGNSIGI